MRHYQLEITLLSATGAGSGEGWAGVIDSDVVFDRYGLPYIPARRIKGILRDMAEDVVNAYQMATGGASAKFQSTGVIALFGKQGQKDSAPLAVGNACLKNHNDITPWLEWAQEEMPEIAAPDRVLSTFTHVRAQTAIANISEVKWLDPKAETEGISDGVADDGSLRLTRVLNAGYTFSSELTVDGDAEKYQPLLALSVQAMRSLGGKRNRGLGEVRCRLLDATSGENVIPSARAYLQKILTAPAQEENSAVESPAVNAAQKEKQNPPKSDESESTTLKKRDYLIRLKAPVLITSSVGDENIAMSEDYLSGTSLLGFFANLYIKTAKPDKPHEDKNFKSWFLSNDLRFLNGYKMIEEKQVDDKIPRRALPIPKSIQFKKTGGEEPFEKLFDKKLAEAGAADKNKEEETKPGEGYCILTDRAHEQATTDRAHEQATTDRAYEQATTEKHHHFHHQRTDQIIGRSDESEIFNYEHLNAGQEFMAAIIGKETALKKFTQWLAEEIFVEGKPVLPGRLGRSKNTQYGLVELDFSIASEPEPAEVNTKAQIDELDETELEIAVTLLSHAILPNEYGQATVEEKWLKTALTEALTKNGLPITKDELVIVNRFVRGAGIENYVAVWKARKPSIFAFEMGSCFLIQIQGGFDEAKLQQLKTALHAVQQDGLGLRRNEGFGRMAINWQTKKKLKNITEDRNKARKALLKDAPDGNMPEAAKNIFATALQDYCAQKVRKFAVEKLDKFPATLSGSQIGRLHRFAETARDETHFKELLKALAKTAREGLEKIKSTETTLLEFLESNHFDAERGDLHKLQGVVDTHQSFFAAVGYDPLTNDKKAGWFKLYLTTFFAMMAKKAKSAKKENTRYEQK